MSGFPVIPQTGFGAVRMEFSRDDGSALMPDWQTNPRIVVQEIAGGSVYRQTTGYNPDSITVVGETQDAIDARALEVLLATENTLTLEAAVGHKEGTYRAIQGRGYRTYANTFLAALEPLGGRRSGRFRFRLTFERAHGS
jgi:hypothetical protein